MQIHPEIISANITEKPARLWMPKRVVFTADSMNDAYAQQIYEKVKDLGLKPELLKNNRITGLRGKDERETYKIAKSTLAIVRAPASAMRLTPIPPSADWQFHLAQGCPAHCQYCYLAGSLSGPPAIRVYSNLPEILANNINYEQPEKFTTFEASCYTDPLSLEHLTGGLNMAIRHFAARPDTQLRFVTKFDNVDSLLPLIHNGRTRCRISLNAEPVSRRLEGGTASLEKRIQALRKLALPREQGGSGYPIGVVLAPIMPIENWEDRYGDLLNKISSALNFECDLTFELISHRFTPGSKQILQGWYPNSSLEMQEDLRSVKRNKFGGFKYVYTSTQMKELRSFFESLIALQMPAARILYWT